MEVRARQILDSRGIPTVEVELSTNKDVFVLLLLLALRLDRVVACRFEAIELRDGYSVTKAVGNINDKISEALTGLDPTLQSQIDEAMIDLDKTEKKGELGVNTMLAVSMSAGKAGAAEKEVPLYKHIAELSGGNNTVIPVPSFTVLSGGKQAGNDLTIQEIMVLPIGTKTFEEAMQMGSETYHNLKAVITEKVWCVWM